MTLERIARIRRRVFADLALVAALGGLVGVEIASLASVTDDLAAPPRGVVVDGRGAEPGGDAVAQPCGTPRLDDRVARGNSGVTTPTTL